MNLILASGSLARSQMLQASGISFGVEKAFIDEESVKEALLAESATAHEIADILAEIKALAVSAINPRVYILGADQVLSLDGNCLSKAKNITEAKQNLQALSDKKHSLISAAVIAFDGQVIWRAIDKATLKMRPLSDDFIDSYLDKCGEEILSSVGCYHLEGLGAQLFESVEGDYFTVLGMPLLKVLHFCRTQGIIMS